MTKDKSQFKEKRESNRHNPLHKDMGHHDEEDEASISKRNKGEKRLQKRQEKTEDDYIPQSISKKILEQAQHQQEEIGQEDLKEPEAIEKYKGSSKTKKRSKDEVSDDEVIEDEEEEKEKKKKGLDNTEFNEEENEIDEDNEENYLDNLEEIPEEDEKVLEMFMLGPSPYDVKRKINLGEVILQKIREKEQGTSYVQDKPKIDPKVVQVYYEVGKFLSTYKSGKIPKPFKIIPSLANWEEVLIMTNPELWTAHATYQATRLFASNLKEQMAQRFFNIFLLPKVRMDITHNKRLNFHLYMALKKALYKPGAFYKGIVLPLCEEGNCTLREALIISSPITKVSVPADHSAAVLLKLAEMTSSYNPAVSIFIKVLVNKKYALPYRTIDALVVHFMSFASDSRLLPVLWHQSLLYFAQRYKTELTLEQKEGLYTLFNYQHHDKITPEIRRELQNSKCRGDEEDIDMTNISGTSTYTRPESKTMMVE